MANSPDRYNRSPGGSGDRLTFIPPSRWAWPAALAFVFLAAIVLRSWSIGHGLPYVWGVDESGHFTPLAVQTALTGWNVHYFENPPAFTYLLRVIFQIGWGRLGLVEQWRNDPSELILAARWTSALLGSLACIAVAEAGRRMFDRLTGLTAGLVLAVAFLAVSYGHFSLNDSPTLLPASVVLLAVAALLQKGPRPGWFVLAGVGVGLAAATKYTAVITALPILFAAFPLSRRSVGGLVIAAFAAFAAFALANPAFLFAWDELRVGLSVQQGKVAEAKLGLWTSNPLRFYGDAAAWGFGLLPMVAAGGGVVVLARDRRIRVLGALGCVPLALMVMLSANHLVAGSGDMAARWLLPAFPFLAILTAVGVVRAVSLINSPRLGNAAAVALILAVCAQGVVLSARTNTVLGRTDTRQVLRDWMVANIPRGTLVAAEPGTLPFDFNLNPSWAKPSLTGPAGPIWNLSTAAWVSDPLRRSYSPALLERYRSTGRCTLISMSTIRGRAFVDPPAAPALVDYYKVLDRSSVETFRASPWRGNHRERFEFARSHLYFDGSQQRPGPLVEVRRLRNCRQARGTPATT
ncbi:MAG: glycosyltransferase family 39 protein [Actinomycetes bacterium]